MKIILAGDRQLRQHIINALTFVPDPGTSTPLRGEITVAEQAVAVEVYEADSPDVLTQNLCAGADVIFTCFAPTNSAWFRESNAFFDRFYTNAFDDYVSCIKRYLAVYSNSTMSELPQVVRDRLYQLQGKDGRRLARVNFNDITTVIAAFQEAIQTVQKLRASMLEIQEAPARIERVTAENQARLNAVGGDPRAQFELAQQMLQEFAAMNDQMQATHTPFVPGPSELENTFGILGEELNGLITNLVSFSAAALDLARMSESIPPGGANLARPNNHTNPSQRNNQRPPRPL